VLPLVEIEEALEAVFMKALNDSSFGDLSLLLVPTLLSWVQRRSAQDLEMIGLLGEINLGSFKELGWSDTLDGLPNSLREKVEAWLTSWHEVTRATRMEFCYSSNNLLIGKPNHSIAHGMPRSE
jgi:hypothetical protein